MFLYLEEGEVWIMNLSKRKFYKTQNITIGVYLTVKKRKKKRHAWGFGFELFPEILSKQREQAEDGRIYFEVYASK